MTKSYTGNYIKIYLTQGISILLGILSLLIVIPHISSDKNIYGVYSLCISTLMFLSYADIGFLGVGIKYAAEYYGLRNEKDELGIIGFSSFIMLLFVCLISLIYVILGIAPDILLTGIEDNPVAYDTARKLFFIMALFSPSIVIQRIAFAVYSVRIQDYINQYITIVGNILKILSVFVFFANDRYLLVEYFLFIQVVSLITPIVSLAIARIRLKVNVPQLVKSIRWNRFYFNRTKHLAIASFLSTLAWIAYYELDQIFIAKLFGSSTVAIYAVAFTLLSYIRTLYGAYFSPYSARINHLRVLEDKNILKNFYHNIIKISIPISIIPQLVFIVFAKDFIICWSGPQYLESVNIARLLLLCNFFAFISYPGGLLLTALEKYKMIRYASLASVILYWTGILFLKNFLGVNSFAFMKLAVFIFMVSIYFYASYKFLNMSAGGFLKSLIEPAILSIAITLIIGNLLHFKITLDKELTYFLLVCGNIGFVTLASFFTYITLNKPFQVFIFERVNTLIRKKH